MSFGHVMLDLETLSAADGAAIVQIAAVEFDPKSNRTGSYFDCVVRDPSGRIDASTVAWWMQQTAAPALGKKMQEGFPEAGALHSFRSWFPVGAKVWCHGATFDAPILAAAFSRNSLPVPWKFRDVRDTRTLFDLAGGTPNVALALAGVEHDALYDCKVQVAQVQVAYHILGLSEEAEDK